MCFNISSMVYWFGTDGCTVSPFLLLEWYRIDISLRSTSDILDCICEYWLFPSVAHSPHSFWLLLDLYSVNLRRQVSKLVWHMSSSCTFLQVYPPCVFTELMGGIGVFPFSYAPCSSQQWLKPSWVHCGLEPWNPAQGVVTVQYECITTHGINDPPFGCDIYSNTSAYLVLNRYAYWNWVYSLTEIIQSHLEVSKAYGTHTASSSWCMI